MRSLISLEVVLLRLQGHLEKYGILLLMIERLKANESPGRRRTSWSQNLRDWFGQRAHFFAAVV